MDLWLNWIMLSILFIIIEFFLWSKNFLILWLISSIIWIISLIFWLEKDLLILSFIFFIITWAISIVLLKPFTKPSQRRNQETNIKNETFIIKNINQDKKIYIDWKYYDIKSFDKLRSWDTVKIVEKEEDQIFKVKKII